MADSLYEGTNIFAKILSGEMPAHKVFEDEIAFAFMDIMPRADGHTLVIPKVPCRNLLDIEAEDLSALMPRVQKVARGVKRAMQAEGLTLQQFNEQAGGQIVFHLHFHILPRWSGVALRPPASQMEKSEVLAANAEKIRAALASG